MIVVTKPVTRTTHIEEKHREPQYIKGVGEGGVYFTERNGKGTHVPEVMLFIHTTKVISSRH